MHLFHIREKTSLRLFANFELPENPICWLRGHRARVEIKESRHSEAWRLIRCKVCDKRYEPDYAHRGVLTMLYGHGRDRAFTAAELYELERAEGLRRQQMQVEVARRDPQQVEMSASGRRGYGIRQLELSCELHVRHTHPRNWHPSFRLHVGGRGSETPYDAHLDVGPSAIYLGLGGIGHRWASWITRGKPRELKLAVHGGQLWWQLWDHDDRSTGSGWRTAPWSRERKYRPYLARNGAPLPARSGNVNIHPLDYLYGGPLRYSYIDVGGPKDAFLIPEQGYEGDGPYLIRWQLQRSVRSRPRGPKELSWIAKWDASPGIPWRNHDWKGDTFTGGAVALTDAEADGDWIDAATRKLVAETTKNRTRYGYSWPGADHYRIGADT